MRGRWRKVLLVVGVLALALSSANVATAQPIREDFDDLRAWSIDVEDGEWNVDGGAAIGRDHAWLTYAGADRSFPEWNDLEVAFTATLEPGARVHVNQRNGADRVFATMFVEEEGEFPSLHTGLGRGHGRAVATIVESYDTGVVGSSWAVRFGSSGDEFWLDVVPIGPDAVDAPRTLTDWDDASRVLRANDSTVPDAGSFAFEVVTGEVAIHQLEFNRAPIESLPPTAPPNGSNGGGGGGGGEREYPEWVPPAIVITIVVAGGYAVLRMRRRTWRRRQQEHSIDEREEGRCEPEQTRTIRTISPQAVKRRRVTALRIDAAEVDDRRVVRLLNKALAARSHKRLSRIDEAARALAVEVELRAAGRPGDQVALAVRYRGPRIAATFEHEKCAASGRWPSPGEQPSKTWTAKVKDDGEVALGVVALGDPRMADELTPRVAALVRELGQLVPRRVSVDLEVESSVPPRPL